MSKVPWHITMSLDGFIAPRDYSTEWMSEHGSAGPTGRAVMERTGAILAGAAATTWACGPAQGRAPSTGRPSA
jgi:hypothetical protein